jgi:hypothetical protein
MCGVLTYHLCAFSSSYSRSSGPITPPKDLTYGPPSTSTEYTYKYFRFVETGVVVVLLHHNIFEYYKLIYLPS